MKDKIIKVLQEITDQLVSDPGDLRVGPSNEIKVDIPQNPEFGDYSTNVALQHNSQAATHNSPRQVAEEIVEKLHADKDLSKVIEKITIAGPGFINFYLSKDVLFDTLRNINLQKDTFGKGTLKKGKKVVVEYTDPNPFKEFHVGHLYSNTVGESIARLLEWQGATVFRADYFGDVGMHVAKAIWGLLNMFELDSESSVGSSSGGSDPSALRVRPHAGLEKLAEQTLASRIEYFGRAYAKGATEYEEGSEKSKEEMKALNFLIFKVAQEVVLPQFKEKPQVDYDRFIKKSKYIYEDIKEIYETGRAWSLTYFESIYKRLGMGFDGYYPESRTGEYGYGMVLDGLEKGIFEKGEGGAIIFPGEKHGLHNRVFINSLNLPTYETKDFGNAVAKHKDFAYDESVIVTGNEINEYFHVVLKALFLYKKELSEATTHIGHGMVRLPEGKMSSRTGKIIRGEWVLDEAKDRARKIMDSNIKHSDLTEKEKDNIAEVVAQGAIKYAFLKQGIGGNIAFDFETSLSFDGNSGPYLQYTYARCQSLLNKSKNATKMSVGSLVGSFDPSLELPGGPTPGNPRVGPFEPEEESILRTLVHFPEALKEAAINHNPSLVCTYLYDLAQKFNGFYNKYSILGGKHQPTTNFRLALTMAVGQTLKNGLTVLGIQAPERM